MGQLINDGHVGTVRNRAMEGDGIWLPTNGGRPYIIDFAADGTMTVRRKKADGTWAIALDGQDLDLTNGAIYVEEPVGVRGVVDGRATIATPAGKSIYVLDDLTYASASTKSEPFGDGFDVEQDGFDDKLGLIAGDDIVFYKGWSSDWSDMYVMASMLAVNGSIRNQYYQSYGYKTLNVLGGLAQDTRGAVGTSGNTGFLKNYKYDVRFYTEPPPHFPVAMYEVNAWDLVK
jgi:hypothetical protein